MAWEPLRLMASHPVRNSVGFARAILLDIMIITVSLSRIYTPRYAFFHLRARHHIERERERGRLTMSERCHVGYHHFPPLNGHDMTWALFRRTRVAERFSGIWRPAWSCCLSLPKGQLGLPELAIGEFVKVLCIFLAPRTKQIHRAT